MKLIFCLALLPCIYASQLSCPDGKTCPPGEACCALTKSSFKCCNAGLIKENYGSVKVVSNRSGLIYSPEDLLDANNGGCIEGFTCGGTCCPDEKCCPNIKSATCCPTDSCCAQESYCCHDKGCCPTGKECCGNYCCGTGNKCCGNNECCPIGSTCCKKGCCPNGSTCCDRDNKCCPYGYVCCPYKGCCPIGRACCGDKCCAHGKVCRGGDIAGYCTDSSSYMSPSIVLFSSAILLFVLKRYNF